MRKLKNKLFILCLFCISCAEIRPQLPIYGNWCGPGYPRKDKNPVAIDIIDDACRTHDLCYRQYGFFDKQCDMEFVQNLKNIAHLSKNKKIIQRDMLNYMTPYTYSNYNFD